MGRFSARNLFSCKATAFVLLFAILALTFGFAISVDSGLVGDKSIGDTAYAADDDQTQGSIAPIHNAAEMPTVNDFAANSLSGAKGFPGNSPNVTEWYAKHDLNDYTNENGQRVPRFSLDTNISAYVDSGSDQAFPTFNHVENGFDLAWIRPGSRQPDIYFDLHYYLSLSPFFLQLLQGNEYTMYAKVNGNVTIITTGDTGIEDGFFGYTNSKEPLLCTEQMKAAYLTKPAGPMHDTYMATKKQTIDSKGSHNINCDWIPLSANNPYLILTFYFNSVYGVGSITNTARVTNLSIELKIVRTGKADGEDKVVNDGASPLIVGMSSDANAANEDIYGAFGSAVHINDNVYNELSQRQDTPGVGSTSTRLLSYTRRDLRDIAPRDGTYAPSGITIPQPYYKRITVDIADYYKYYGMKDIVRGDKVDERYASGIKFLNFSGSSYDNKINYYDNGRIGTPIPITIEYETGDGRVEQRVAAYVCIERKGFVTDDEDKVDNSQAVNKSRSRLLVTIYFCENIDLHMTVTDYGGLSMTHSFKVEGIDTTAPDVPYMETADGYVGQSLTAISDLKWWHGDVSDFAVTDNAEDISYGRDPREYSKYMWFYTAEYSKVYAGEDTFPEFQKLTYEQLLGATPFATEYFTDFAFDFIEGKASGKYDPANSVGDVEFGPGYYRFAFYTMDLAGNLAADTDGTALVQVYYVKVDNKTPENTVSITGAAEGSDETVTPEENGLKWIKDGPLKLTVGLKDGWNISGNMLMFDTQDSKDVTVYIDTGGEPRIVKAEVGGKVIIPEKGSECSFENITVRLNGRSPRIDVIYGATVEENGMYTEFDYNTEFTVYAGNDAARTDAPYANDGAWTLSGASRGVYIKVDRNAPSDPEMSADRLKSSNDNDFNIDDIDLTAEQWYTKWQYSPNIAFLGEEEKLDRYGSDIKVFIGMTIHRTADEFIADFNAGAVTAENSRNYFDYLNFIEGKDLDSSGQKVLEKQQLYNEHGSGIRVFYVWAQDQAGNVGPLNVYYMLVDGTEYNIYAKIDSGVLDDAGVIFRITDGMGNDVRRAYRGDELTILSSVPDDIVPYRVALYFGDGSNVAFDGEGTTDILCNDLTVKRIEAAEGGYKKFIKVGGTYGDVKFMLNKPEIAYNLGEDSAADTPNNDIYFIYKYRKVINYTLTPDRVEYNGERTAPDIPAVINNHADVSQVQFEAVYKTEDGTLLDAAPYSIGSYKLSLSIAADDPDFAADPVKDWAYRIIKRRAVIVAEAVTSVYGDELRLIYTIENIAEADRAAHEAGTFLKTGGITAGEEMPDAGEYPITVGEEFTADNYEFTYRGALLTVTRRPVYVTPLDSTKGWMDADPVFEFSADTSDFAPGDTYRDVFGNDIEMHDNNIFRYTDRPAFLRKEGDELGRYEYTAALIDVSDNYEIRAELGRAGLTIEKKKITVYVQDGQYSVVSKRETVTESFLGGIDVAYTTDASSVYSKYIGKLSVTDTLLDKSTDTELWYLIEAADCHENIVLTVVPEQAAYLIKIAAKAALVAKQPLEYVYGTDLGEKLANVLAEINEDIYKYFDVINDSEGKLRIGRIDYGSDPFDGVGMPDAGYYSVELRAIAENASDLEQGFETFAELRIRITPYEVTVRPLPSVKTYGDADVIEYELLDGEGKPASAPGLQDSVSGQFARALFGSSGNFDRWGARFDSVSDSGGKVIGAYYDTYYRAAVLQKFVSKSPNFVLSVDETALEDCICVIEPRTITVGADDLIGKNKYFDGTAEVYYEEDELMARIRGTVGGDEIRFAANAVYDSAEAGERAITFSEAYLTGDKAANYRLVLIDADGGEAASVTIYDMPDGSRITIYEVTAITLTKNAFVVSKQYDGGTSLTAGNISINIEQLKNIKFTLRTQGLMFGSKDVSTQILPEIELDILVDNTEFLLSDGGSADITVDKISAGYRVTVSEVQASITPRVINFRSMAQFAPVDRPYNAETGIGFTYEYKAGALAAGDSADSVRLIIEAYAADKNAGSGKPVTVKSVRAVNADNEICSNYTVIEESFINRPFTADIAKAQLMPDIVFNNVIYNGKAEVDYRIGDGIGITVSDKKYITETLLKELEAFDTSDPTSILYSKNMQIYPFVNRGADGEVLPHDILIGGWMITVNGDVDLGNYAVYGTGADIESGKTISQYEIAGIAPLNPYEITVMDTDVMGLDKVYDGTNRANAYVRISNLPDPGMIEVRLSGRYNSAAANADSRGNLLAGAAEHSVDLTPSGIVNTDDAEGIDYAGSYAIAKNNVLGTLKGRIMRKTVEVGMGQLKEKIYDGTPETEWVEGTYTLSGLVGADIGSYALRIAQANYFDKNVSVVDGAAAEKIGGLFGLTIVNIRNRGEINYELAVDSTDKYISYADFAVNPVDADSIVGSWNTGDEWVYLLDAEYAGPCGTLNSAVNYAKALGRINKRPVTITVNKNDPEAFIKPYDSRTTFYGKFGEDYTVSLGGIVAGDDISGIIKAENVSAMYAKPSAGDTQVVFRITPPPAGANPAADNYEIAAIEKEVSAEITRAVIRAEAEDETVEYGSRKESYGKLAYFYKGLADSERQMLAIGDAMYMTVRDFLDVFAFDAPDTVTGYYKIEDGEAVLLSEYTQQSPPDESEYDKLYVGLFGNFSFPKGSCEVTGLTGAGSAEYPVRFSEGYASNWKFDVSGAEASVTVTKKTIYAYVDGTYEMTYFDADSLSDIISEIGPRVSYEGIVADDNSPSKMRWDNIVIALFTKDRADSEWALTDGDVAASEIAPTDHLKDKYADAFYALMLAGTGTSETDNYLIEIRYAAFDALSHAEALYGNGRLTVGSPVITDIVLRQNGSEMEYSGGDTGSYAIVSGLRDGDKTEFAIEQYVSETVDGKTVWKWVKTDTVRAGFTYRIGVTVKRLADGKYEYTPYTGTVQDLTVTKASLGMWGEKIEKDYDPAHGVEISKDDIKFRKDIFETDAVKANIALSYYRVGADGGLTAVSEMKDAGSYIAEAVYTDKGGATDFEGETARISVTIKAIEIVLNILSDTLLESLDEFAFKADVADRYDVAYALPVIVSSFDGDAGGKPGIYRYTVEVREGADGIDKSNYVLTGDRASGIVRIGAKQVTSGTSERSSLTAADDELLFADSMYYKEIKRGTANAADAGLWNGMQQRLPDKAVRSVVMVRMMRDGEWKNPSGTVTVRAALPSAVSSLDGITVYRYNKNGELEELTDYRVENGCIVYDADYLDFIVFAGGAPDAPADALEAWEVALIAIAAAAAAVGIAVGIAALLGKKRKKA